jgi:VIT1/CCC1 family predicted Fe2+/Mn2+ transporter
VDRKSGYLRNFVFGVEDSLVSTVGLLSGVAATGSGSQTIFTTGVILIFVEALSMAIGSFLSENSAEEFAKHREEPFSISIPDSLIMFFSYFVSGFIPLFPYIFLPAETALPISIGASLAALCLLGVVSGKVSRTSVWKGILKMVILGGIAIAAGVAVGSLLG